MSQPNLLFLLADQFRHDCLGVRGLRPVRTPNLDALAARGLLYENAFTPLPVCAPARQALLCGRHPDSFGAWWNYDMLQAGCLMPGETLPEKLSARGYEGAYLGKWHISATHGPEAFGFGYAQDFSGHKRLIREKYPNLEHPGGWLGCDSPIALQDSDTHWLAARGVETLERFANGDKPWHIWLDFGVPHLPCRPSAPFSALYDAEDMRPWPGFGDPFINKPYTHRQQMLNWRLENHSWEDFAPGVARYLAMISQLDDAIGRVIDALRDSGQFHNTIIVFTSDHGDMCSSHQMLDKHNSLYDDIVRVPLIISGPGVRGKDAFCSNADDAQGAINDLQPARIDALVSSCIDVPVTLAATMGLSALPGAHGRMLPGIGPMTDRVSSPNTERQTEPGSPPHIAAVNRSPAQPRRYVTSSTNGQQFGLVTSRMLRDTRFKYIWNATDIDELYDLEADPGEHVNLAHSAAHAALLAVMRRELHARLKAHDDPFIKAGWLDGQLLEGRKA